MLRTKTKLRIARTLNRLVTGSRKLLGQRGEIEARRGGVTWRLDLDEGIDFAIYLGLYQKLPQRVLTQFITPDSLAVDIGANIGSHSLQMARAVSRGRIVSVEPTAYAFTKLKANIASNPTLSNRLIPIHAALDDGLAKHAPERFYSRWPLRNAGPELHPEHLGKLEPADGARRLTLDMLLEEIRAGFGVADNKLRFIKLDVDGNELAVLRGGRRTFTVDRPALLMEVAPHVQDEVPNRFEELISLLTEFGYSLEDAHTGKPLPNSSAKLRRTITYGASVDVLARPENH